MAREIAGFPEDAPLPRLSGVHPWNDWLNGKVWELTQGVDFPGKTTTFRQNAAKKASERKGRLRMSTLEDGKRVIIQFVPNSKG